MKGIYNKTIYVFYNYKHVKSINYDCSLKNREQHNQYIDVYDYVIYMVTSKHIVVLL